MKVNNPKKGKKNERYHLLLQNMKETQLLLPDVKNELEKQVQLSNLKKDKRQKLLQPDAKDRKETRVLSPDVVPGPRKYGDADLNPSIDAHDAHASNVPTAFVEDDKNDNDTAMWLSSNVDTNVRNPSIDAPDERVVNTQAIEKLPEVVHDDNNDDDRAVVISHQFNSTDPYAVLGVSPNATMHGRLRVPTVIWQKNTSMIV